MTRKSHMPGAPWDEVTRLTRLEGPVQSAVAALRVLKRSLYTVRVIVTARLGLVLGSPRCGAQATKSRW